MYEPVFIIDMRRKVYYLAWYDGLAEMRKVANDEYFIAVRSLPGKFRYRKVIQFGEVKLKLKNAGYSEIIRWC